MADQSLRTKVQRFGGFLSGMIMPNIGAFIAWGIISALFIEEGLIPYEPLGALYDPMITYLLPLLIGYTGGTLIHDKRGGVIGAIATMGVIAGADIPMFLGAMVMGPLAGYLLKKTDNWLQHKIPAGFEMLYNNFSTGILGAIIAGIAAIVIGPVVEGLNNLLAAGVDVIINAGLLPLASIIIEPAKILFLNNAINHGILDPIGVEQAKQTGKSILFLLEANPGPGLGILLAFSIFGTGNSKSSAPGAALIQFVGGIHEIYFPYVLMKPALLLAVIGGGISGVFTFSLFSTGLVAPASPGSIIAVFAMIPTGHYMDYIAVAAGVVIAALVSFVIAAIIMKTSKVNEGDLTEATDKMESMKGKESSVSDALKQDTEDVAAETAGGTEDAKASEETAEQSAANVDKVVFACDAGMGSSAMGASLLKNKFKKAEINVEVTNTAIKELPDDADIVITHKDLTEQAKETLPDAEHISVDNFLNSPEYDKLTERLQQ